MVGDKDGPRAGTPEATFKVRVRPGASRTEIAGFFGDALAVRIAAPPERGRANRALLTLLAQKLGVKEAEVEVVAGPASRDKIVRVTGLGREELEARLRSLAGREP